VIQEEKKPRNCYATPRDPRVCMITGLFEYLTCFPQVLEDPDGPLFPGSDQSGRFSEILKCVLFDNEVELNAMGFECEDIGTHSIRKGGTTYLSSGTTAGPSASSINVRGNWSQGDVRDVYMLWALAGDQYCGRILSGLPVLSSDFALLYPDFIKVEKGTTRDEFEANKIEVDGKAASIVASIFGVCVSASMQKFLRVGMACSLHHREELDRLYPANAMIRTTMLYTEADVLDMAQYVKVAKVGEDVFAERVTGIPPHVIQQCLLEELKSKIDSLVPQFCEKLEEQLDRRTFNGVISEERMKAMIDASNTGVQEQLRLLFNKATVVLLKRQEAMAIIHHFQKVLCAFQTRGSVCGRTATESCAAYHQTGNFHTVPLRLCGSIGVVEIQSS
jgi:hypothetical protein